MNEITKISGLTDPVAHFNDYVARMSVLMKDFDWTLVEPLADAEVFERCFARLYRDFGGRPIGEQSLTRQMMRTVRMAVESGMEFPNGAFPVIKSLMYLDGMALSCAPEKVLLDDVVEFAGDFR